MTISEKKKVIDNMVKKPYVSICLAKERGVTHRELRAMNEGDVIETDKYVVTKVPNGFIYVFGGGATSQFVAYTDKPGY